MSRKRIIAMLSIVIIIIWIRWTNINIEVSKIEIENKKIPVEFAVFKIAQVSDLHNQEWSDQLINKIKKEKPDMIAITGDLVDSSKTDFDRAIEFIHQANQLAPIYYVTGNHEAWLDDYSLLKKKLKQAQVKIMDGQSFFIKKGQNKIQILGVQDPDFIERMDVENIQGAIVSKQIEDQLDPTYFNIVLSHRPEHFKAYIETGADLILTGHAHGGQFRFPFIGGLIAPNQGFFPTYTSGLYQEDQTDMVVSRGLGHSIIPFRINNRPELVIIELNNKKDIHN